MTDEAKNDIKEALTPKPERKIAMLGGAPSSNKLVPCGDPSWEIWACSPGNYNQPRVDSWFELHSLDRKFSTVENLPYHQALMNHPSVYVSVADARLPKAKVYPLKEVLSYFGDSRYLRSFMQSSVSYMLALAIMQKVDEIGMWGIDMSANDEYGLQRPGCHYFFEKAEQAGIKVIAAPQSDILEHIPLYAYKEHSSMYWKQKARMKEMESRIAEAENKVKHAEMEMWMLRGCKEDIHYINNTFLPDDVVVTDD